ncbi:MAG: outer membrane protein assembly factor BamA [Xanthomonadaceae bacterium]|nr:outer membrane protein assembly factor BamA [Xanthomonadaceae bacterium]
MNYRSTLRPLWWLPMIIALAWPPLGAAQETGRFVVEDIEVVGLQRITEGTLFNYLPVNIGDTLTPDRTAQALRALFTTQFFHDVELRRDGNTLVVAVTERPTIASFTVTGNKDIKDDDLRGVLRGVGLAEGRIFDRGVLESVEVELRRQYFNRGKYAVTVDTEVREVPGNLVEIAITIAEGQVARIREVNFVGNHSFSNRELAGILELRRSNWLSFYRKDDQYSREKLQGDLESLRSFYMDQGYAAFEVESLQVAISPDKRDVFITVNIKEGGKYRIGEIRLAGNLILDEPEMRRLVLFNTGDSFHHRAITLSTELMTRRLGEEGYANAEVAPLPDFGEEDDIVDITLFFEPGNRVYVRRINFVGASATNDETFRREMRQLEGSWLQNSAIDRSKTRLQRLPFVAEVEITPTPVAGSDEFVDIDIEIEEREPGHFQFGAGYSGAFGVMLNAGVTHSNFLGEGRRVQINLARSEFSQTYNLSFTEPYWTVNGISRNWGVFFREADQLFAQGSPMFINTWGGNIGFGIPLSEFMFINVGATLAQHELIASFNSTPYLQAWVRNPNHGENFENLFPDNPLANVSGTRFRTIELNLGWSRDTRNRAIFPSAGSRLGVSGEISVPPSEISYYMGTLFNHSYWTLRGDTVLSFRTELTAGRGYRDTSGLPPYKFVFAGGPESIRGYRENWLGPQDDAGFPVGGNVRMFSQIEIMIPPPSEKLRNSSRIGLFVDAGNVFQGRDSVSFDEMRMSAGLAATWLAPIGAMKISYAVPLNDKPGDRLERLQFSIGSAF